MLKVMLIRSALFLVAVGVCTQSYAQNFGSFDAANCTPATAPSVIYDGQDFTASIVCVKRYVGYWTLDVAIDVKNPMYPNDYAIFSTPQEYRFYHYYFSGVASYGSPAQIGVRAMQDVEVTTDASGHPAINGKFIFPDSAEGTTDRVSDDLYAKAFWLNHLQDGPPTPGG